MAASDDPTIRDEALEDLVRRGLRWSFINTAAGRTASFLVGVVLARLVAPADFGIYAVALVTTSFLLSLNDVGISAAIVRWPGDIREIAPTAMTIIMAFSVAMYAMLFAAAPALADAFNVPGSAGILRLLGLSVVLDAFFAVPSISITRSLSQERRAGADMVSLVFGSVLSIVLAAAGLGAWGLAWGRLAGNLAGGIVILVVAPLRARPGFDPPVARELVHFGLPLAGAAVLTFGIQNADYVVVGHVLGETALGFYFLAFNLSSWPVNILSFSVRRVSLAGFSRLQHDVNAMRAGFVRAVRLLSALAFPACALLAVLALPLVTSIYGERWSPAATPLRWLALLGAVRVLAELAEDYLVAAGRPRTIVALHTAWLVVLIPTLIIGANAAGINGVGAAHAVVAGILVIPATLWAVHRTHLHPSTLLRALLPSVALAAFAAGAAALGASVVTGDFAQLIVGGVAGLAATALGLAIARRVSQRRASTTSANLGAADSHVGDRPNPV